MQKIFFFILLASSCFGQSEENVIFYIYKTTFRNDTILEKRYLKSIETYNKSNKIASIWLHYDKGIIKDSTFVSYNKKGSFEKIVTKSKEMRQLEGEYFYDKYGNTIKKVTPNEVFEYENKYTWRKLLKSQTYKSVYSGKEERLLFKYNLKKQNVSQQLFEDKVLKIKTLNKYRSSKKIETLYVSKTSTIKYTFFYHGNQFFKHKMFENDTLSKIFIRFFNQNGMKTKEETFNNQNQLIELIEYEKKEN